MHRALSYIERIATVILLVATIFLIYAGWSRMRIAGLVEDAISSYNSAEMTVARERVEDALKHAPTNSAFLVFKGETLSSQGYFKEAENVMREAYEKGQGSSDACVGLASVLAAQGNISEAEAIIRNADTDDARIVKAGIAFSKGNNEEARDILFSVDLKNCSFGGVAAYYLLSGSLAVTYGRYEDAIDNAIKLVSMLPKSESLRPLSGGYSRLCAEAQRLMAAAGVMWLLSAKKDEVDAVFAKVVSLVDTKAVERYGVAAQWWVNMSYGYFFYLAGADAFFRAGKYKEAAVNYETAIKRMRGGKEFEPIRAEFEPVVWQNAAYAAKMQSTVEPSLAEKRQYLNQAADFYQKVISHKGVTTGLKFDATILRAIAYFEAGSFRLAEESFLQARTYQERVYIAELNLAVCYDCMKDYDKALKWYENVLKYPDLPFKEGVARRIEQLKGRKEKK